MGLVNMDAEELIKKYWVKLLKKRLRQNEITGMYSKASAFSFFPKHRLFSPDVLPGSCKHGSMHKHNIKRKTE